MARLPSRWGFHLVEGQGVKFGQGCRDNEKSRHAPLAQCKPFRKPKTSNARGYRSRLS